MTDTRLKPTASAERQRWYKRERERKQAEAERQQAALDAARAVDTIDWIEKLVIPPGNPRAGKRMYLAEFQRKWIVNSLLPHVRESLLCVARKNAKSFTCAALLLSYLVGNNHQPGNKVVCVSLSLEHIQEIQQFMLTLAETNSLDITNQKTPRPGNLVGPQGTECRFLSGSANSAAISTGAQIVVCDELGSFPENKAELISHLKTVTAGRDDGKFLALSFRGTSSLLEDMVEAGKDDPAIYIQMHEAPIDCSLDDVQAWHAANPGLAAGIKSMKFMKHACKQAMSNSRYENAYRGLQLNQKLEPSRVPIISLDQWRHCIAAELPARKGKPVVGIDCGGSDSFSAAFMYWPETQRAESFSACGSIPSALRPWARRWRRRSLRACGAPWRVGDAARATVRSICRSLWRSLVARLETQPLCIVADRFRQG